MSVLAVIPARSGSKGIPNKNIRLLAGHPLLAWSIAAARLSKRIDRVLVGTDSEEYANIARRYGVEVPFLRPAEISGDESRDIEYLRYMVKMLDTETETTPPLLVILRPTSPLRGPAMLDEAIEMLDKAPWASSLRSVQDLPFFPEKCVKLDSDGTFSGILSEDYIGVPRQLCPKSYLLNGCVDIVRTVHIRQAQEPYGSKRLGFVTAPTPETDTPEDWREVSRLIRSRQFSQLSAWLDRQTCSTSAETISTSGTWSFPYRDEFEALLDANGLSRKDCCLIKGLSLDAHGIRQAHDCDFCLRQAASGCLKLDTKWEKIEESSEYTVLSCDIIDIDIGYYETLLGISDEEIINNPLYHTIRDGFKVIRPELVFATKAIRQRPHDLRDLDLLTVYAREHPETWDWELVKDPIQGLPAPRFDWCLQEKPRLWAASTLMLSPSMLLSLQYRISEFNAVDTIVRYAAIDGYLHNNSGYIELYKKMQYKRGNYETWDSFVNLIENFNSGFFNYEFPIETDSYGTLFDGSHRLACVLYFDIPLIPILCVQEKFDRDYRLVWFEQSDFTSEELMCISAWQHKVFTQKGIYFSVTLWPPASAYFDAIEEDIAREYAVAGKTDYIYSDDEFEHISRAICTSDDISEWKLLRKQHYMYKGVNQLRQMTIHVPAPTWRKKERGKSLCVEMEALKKKLRSKYKTYVPSYVQDILIHITDNTLQSETVNKLFM